jgi:hypothetical protein
VVLDTGWPTAGRIVALYTGWPAARRPAARFGTAARRRPPPAGPPPGSGPPPPGAGPPPGGPSAGYGYPGAPTWGGQPSPPYFAAPASADRIRLAWQGRQSTDYIFNFWTALGWTILTLGIFGFYVFYQLVRRMRDHNARRLELLDAAMAFGWEEAGRRGLQQELAPSFQRAAAHLAVLRKMTGDFREPVIWVVLSVIAGGIVHAIAFILLDQDLMNHDRAEVGVEYELALVYGRLGHPLAYPDAGRVKGPHSYVGRILASIFSFGIYLLWWYHDMMVEPNRHFYTNWSQEDALAVAVQAMQ